MTQNVIDRNLAARIRSARLAAGWTNRQLADALGVDPRTAARWQAKENPANPSIETLGQIARVLRQSPSYFLEDAA